MSLPLPSDGTPTDRTYHRPRAPRKAWLGLAILGGVAVVLLRWKPFRVEVAGTSMRPELEPGDWALAGSASRVRRGDVVVVEHPARTGFEMVKRVIGLPGDVAPDGRTLGAGEIWVEGDAAEASTDSRSFGAVPFANVRARVRLVYWPPGRRRLL